MKREIFFTIMMVILVEVHNQENCGKINCKFGNCTNPNFSVCDCDSKYVTFPEDNKNNCDYLRKSQLIALILETFVMFGAGHFYMKDYEIAIVKLFIWVFGYFIFISIRFIGNKENANSSSGVMIAFFGCFFCCVMVFWQVVDFILFATNNYKDGNNIDLISWSS